ncbi:MAG: replication-relaxation family protein [Dehalococcoidia bacterium]|nr:replication-relaxation family protein [Dehalococcoidia bacterium]
MRRGERPVDDDILRLLVHMPFLDRLEAVAVSGWSRGGVYGAVERLEHTGLVSSVRHGTELVPTTRRFHLTTDGLGHLARAEGATVECLLRDRPISARWRRVLMERLDAVAVIYRLASAISAIAYPIRFRWYRAMPMDAAVALSDGRTLCMMRQGGTTDRTGFSKRLWRLMEGARFGGILLLVPDEVRLRHARRLLAGCSSLAVLALERGAVAASPEAPIWRLPSVNTAVSLRTALDRIDRGRGLPTERPLSRVSVPEDINDGDRRRDVPEHMLPALLKPAEKRTLDLLSDWPWISQGNLAGLLGVTNRRTSHIVTVLQRFGLATRVTTSGRRLVLTDTGLTLLARRDRASLGGVGMRWSPAPLDVENGVDWREVSGRRSRQLLRDLGHTSAVHGFIAVLARQARSLGWEIAQLDPPHRASRYFMHLGGRRSVHPDAFGILQRGDAAWAFFLEWERRAVRPSTMTARLAPYLRYYSSHRPTDDHGVKPALMVVFDEDIAQAHFIKVARFEMDRVRVAIPLLASHRDLLEQEGPLGRAWFAPNGGWEPVRPTNVRETGQE